ESPLTKQEMNILTKISFGLKDSDIAEQMNISINTVRTHRKNIIRKENANNMVEVVASYIRRGYL
ncbi:MAG: LuxR C-terminal-related transcriptional regulator, partial [Cyclobacteriaceae bacterium]